MKLTHDAYRAIFLPISAQTGRVFYASSFQSDLNTIFST